MRANTSLLALATATLVLASTTATLAQTAEGEVPGATAAAPEGGKVTGTVVSSSMTTLVIRTNTGETLTFRVEPTTSLPTGLMGGDRVEVAYSSGGAEGNVASRVTVFSSPAPSQPGGSDLAASTPPPAAPATQTAPAEAHSALAESADPPAQLPATASPRTVVGLAGALGMVIGLVVLWRSRRARPSVETRARQAH